ncbi:ribosomal RNA-processing protein 8 [Rhinichthys klamathensis goyatoka]|uniref:ribosomal RNA-processing protein 8 n=1 Tax=Rhinichthys klamathensis goyatoka TaxID=3034132 RepID=UPI0024B5570D|nr:ribosomal RNA-processing protein 8 [Rhinichthys klamathensis goyatoka]
MFAEEEWTDSPSADGASHTVKVSPAPCKDKSVAKKSLLRTLQTLGSVPNWEIENVFEDSDEEKDASPVVQTTKKKRCKKRKRRSNADNEGKQQNKVDSPETPTKKQKLMKKAVKGISSKVSQESRKDKNDIGVSPLLEKNESQAETKLSRKQWRNKMKNKNRCKNKYLTKTTGVEDANVKKEPLVKTQDISKSKKVQKQKSQKLTGVEEANVKKEPFVQTQDISKSKKVQKQKSKKLTGVEEANVKKEPFVQTQDISKSKKVQKQKSKKLTGVEEANVKKEPFVQTQDISKSKKVEKQNSKKTKKSCGKNGISSATDDVENGKDFKTDKTSRIADHSLSNGNISHELAGKEKPSKMMKKLQAEKLRRILKLSHTDDGNEATEEPEEPKGTRVNVKSDEEQMATDPSTALRTKMVRQLEAARFRYINELLYTSTSREAKRMFQQDPEAIAVYHKGYTTQVQHWPTNPVDSIISYICQKPPSLVVADFGCGDCKIARSVKNKVHSFDLAPVCDLATACDMANVPLRDSTVDIAVFCLSLMGTNLGEFLAEANRVLVMGGVLKIAEVASRFENIRSFIGALSSLGFKIVNKDTENSHFYSFEFTKTETATENAKKAGLQLKPCLYKKR